MPSTLEPVGATPATPTLPQYRRSVAMLAAEVRDGLSRRQKELPGRFLADREIAEVRRAAQCVDDSRLRLAETPLVEDWHRDYRRTHEVRRVVDLLASGGASVQALLRRPADVAPVGAYVAVDPSIDVATDAARRVSSCYPELVALPMSADPTASLPVRRVASTLFTALGGAIGTFTPVRAIRVLRALRAAMTAGDLLLLGLDLRTPLLDTHVDDAITEQRTRWHRHALAVTNRELGTAFPVERFRYAERWDAEGGRFDLGVLCGVRLRIANPLLGEITLRKGELVRTAVRCVYDQAMLTAMLRGVGLTLTDWCINASGSHALAIAAAHVPDDGRP